MTTHPKPWELRVQSMLRTQRPPFTPPHFMLAGFDRTGLAALVRYEEIDGPGSVFIQAAAVAVRLRGKGGGYADEMVERALDAIQDRAGPLGVSSILVTANVHESNHPSQALCRRFGLAHTWTEGELQQWSETLLLV